MSMFNRGKKGKDKKKDKTAAPATADPATAADPHEDRLKALLGKKDKKATSATDGPDSKAAQQLADSEPGDHRAVLTLTVRNGKFLGDDDSVQPYFSVEYHGQEVRGLTKQGMDAEWNQTFSFDMTAEHWPVRFWLYDASAEDGCALIGGGALITEMKPTPTQNQTITLVGEKKPEIPPLVYVSYSVAMSEHPTRVSMDDFSIEKVIGKGSFGKVMLVRKKDTGRIYALKKISKQHLKDRGEIEHTMSERRILVKSSSPFLVALKFSFQTPDKVYFVLDYVSGGELFVHLQRDGNFSESRSRFYVAMLILALEHLHALNVIYRDLKPENVLIDMNGYLKLTDFGLCKEGIDKFGRTYTFCGTPEYMAPEILQQKGYGMEVDWWTVGTLLFEMLTGLPPFYDQDTQEMYRRILFQPLTFPEEVSLKAQDLITQLLQRNPSARLGRLSAKEIQRHLFFKDMDWAALEKKQLEAPWKPRIGDELDTSNFDEEFTRMRAVDTPLQDTLLSESVQQKFAGFTFVDQGEL